MAAERLPEELVHEVLRHCILASPDIFLDPAHDRSYFLESNAPPSPLGRINLLLVSKRWLRIATPLLFTSLWLPEWSHTHTVALLFQANPHIGKYVLDLRLEGGFGRELLELVKHTPNVKNMSLSWNIGPLDDVSALSGVLLSLSPESLYLGHQLYSRLNKAQSDEAASSVEEYIANGQSLTHVHIAYWFPLTRKTADALQRAPALHTLDVHAEDVYNWSWSADLLCFLDNPALRVVRCRTSAPPARARENMLAKGVRRRVVDALTFVEHAPELGIHDLTDDAEYSSLSSLRIF